MLLNHSWKADSSSVSQDIPYNIWNLLFITIFTTAPPLVSFLSPAKSFHAPPSWFFKILFKIILPSMPGSLHLSLSFSCYHLNPVCISHLPHNCHISSQSYPPWFRHLHNMRWTVQITKLFTKHFSPVFCYTLPPRPNCVPQPMFFQQCERPSFTPTTFH